jgi:hypothetical protein
MTVNKISPISPSVPVSDIFDHLKERSLGQMKVWADNYDKNTANWHASAIKRLDKCDAHLEKKLPNNILQQKIDALGIRLKEKFAPLEKFNKWLDSNGNGAWYDQMATFLAKLPARAVRNVIRLIYQIIYAALYTIVHPIKAINQLARLLTNLIYELSKPEAWAALGIGIVGGALGQTILAPGNPISLIGLAVGGALTLSGISISLIKSAIQAQKGHRAEAVKAKLAKLGNDLSETLLTGFLMGIMMGAVQRAVYQKQAPKFRVTSQKQAETFAQKFAERNHLPKPNSVEIGYDGKIVLRWTGDEMKALLKEHPNFQFSHPTDSYYNYTSRYYNYSYSSSYRYTLNGIELDLHPKSPYLVNNFDLHYKSTSYYNWRTYHYDYHWQSNHYQHSIDKLYLNGRLYPAAPANPYITNTLPIASTALTATSKA